MPKKGQSVCTRTHVQWSVKPKTATNAYTEAGLSRVKSCQLILVAEQGSCCSYARHRRLRFCDGGPRTSHSVDFFPYDILYEICLRTHVHHEHNAP